MQAKEPSVKTLKCFHIVFVCVSKYITVYPKKQIKLQIKDYLKRI